MKKNSTFILILSVLLSSVGCNVSNNSFGNGSKWIPENFNPRKSVLLIENFSKEKDNQKMKDFLAENYIYKYEVVDKKVIESKNGKYTDLELYPYGLVWTSFTHRTGSSTALDWDGNFYDRSSNTNLPSTDKTINYGNQSYKPIINTIVNYYK